MDTKDLILVLGMGRSGSSALTRVLSLCGGTLPPSVLAPREINPRGFWESIDATRLNYEFLRCHSLRPLSLPLSLPVRLSYNESNRRAFLEEIRKFLAACAPSRFLVLKCLGLTELKEFWSEAGRLDGFRVKVAIPFRHPSEVFASLSEARFSAEVVTEARANVAWLRENLLAEWQSRGAPRVFVDYSRLIKDWRTEVARMSTELRMSFMIDEESIDSFLTTDLRHHQHAGSPSGEFGGWASKVYRIFSEATSDASVDTLELDRIRRGYCESASVLRMLKGTSSEADSQAFDEEINHWPIWKSGEDF